MKTLTALSWVNTAPVTRMSFLHLPKDCVYAVLLSFLLFSLKKKCVGMFVYYILASLLAYLHLLPAPNQGQLSCIAQAKCGACSSSAAASEGHGKLSCSHDPRASTRVPWNWNYRSLCAAVWVLGIEPEPCVEASVLPTEPALQPLILLLLTMMDERSLTLLGDAGLGWFFAFV